MAIKIKCELCKSLKAYSVSGKWTYKDKNGIWQYEPFLFQACRLHEEKLREMHYYKAMGRVQPIQLQGVITSFKARSRFINKKTSRYPGRLSKGKI